MTMEYSVGCTTKDAKNERITHIGCKSSAGFYQRMSEAEAIKSIRSGDTFHVTRDGRTVKIIIAEHEGREYIKTEPDGFRPDNLLALDHCKEVAKPSTPPVRTIPAGSHSVL
jgi:hypothetical protein